MKQTIDIPEGMKLRTLLSPDLFEPDDANGYEKPIDSIPIPAGYKRVDYRPGRKGDTAVSWTPPHNVIAIQLDNVFPKHIIIEPDVIERWVAIYEGSGSSKGTYAIASTLYKTENEARSACRLAGHFIKITIPRS